MLEAGAFASVIDAGGVAVSLMSCSWPQVQQSGRTASRSCGARFLAATALRPAKAGKSEAACRAKGGRTEPLPCHQHASAHGRTASTLTDASVAEPDPGGHAALSGKLALGVGLPAPEAHHTARASPRSGRLADLDPGKLLPV